MKKTKKMMAGVVATLMAVSVTACSDNEEVQDSDVANNRPAEPTDVSCGDWDWDEETGTYYCDDTRSSNFGMYYLMGQMFNSKSALKSSSKYKSYQQSYQSTKDGNTTSSGSSKGTNYKSGIGSGSKGGFGG